MYIHFLIAIERSLWMKEAFKEAIQKNDHLLIMFIDKLLTVVHRMAIYESIILALI